MHLRDEVLGRALEHDASHDVEPHAEPSLQARPDEPAQAVGGERAHPARLDRVGPLAEELAAPLVVPARGARQHQASQPLRMLDGEKLRDDATHRRTHDMGALHVFGIEHGDRVVRHLVERERMRGPTAPTDTAIVDGDATEPASERHALERPAPRVRAKPLEHEQRFGVSATEDVVRDRGAVGRDHGLHCWSSNAPTARRTSSASSAAARRSSGRSALRREQRRTDDDTPRADRETERATREHGHGNHGKSQRCREQLSRGSPACLFTFGDGVTSGALAAHGSPLRNQVGASGAAARCPARNSAATSSGR